MRSGVKIRVEKRRAVWSSRRDSGGRTRGLEPAPKITPSGRMLTCTSSHPVAVLWLPIGKKTWEPNYQFFLFFSTSTRSDFDHTTLKYVSRRKLGINIARDTSTFPFRDICIKTCLLMIRIVLQQIVLSWNPLFRSLFKFVINRRPLSFIKLKLRRRIYRVGQACFVHFPIKKLFLGDVTKHKFRQRSAPNLISVEREK